MNFYKHHLGDYDGATAHLSWDEDLAYRRLLGVYYRSEEAIPAGQAHRLVRATTARQKAAVDTVLQEFFERDGELWRNKRADTEIAAYQHQVSVNRRVGKLGGRPNRIETESVTEPIPNRNPNHKPLTKNHKPEEALTTTAVEPKALPPKKNGHAVGFDFSTCKFEGITDEHQRRWQEAYPAIPVPDEIERAASWLQANPANRKSNYTRFLVNWFSRSQDKAGRVK